MTVKRAFIFASATLVVAACSSKGTPPPPETVAPVSEPTLELAAAEDCDALRERTAASVVEAVVHARYGGIRIDDKLGGKGDDTRVDGPETNEIESEPPATEPEDLVKVTGRAVHVVLDDAYRIVALADDGVPSLVGAVELGPDLTAVGMFVHDETAVLLHETGVERDDAAFEATRVTFVDVSDPAQPTLMRQFDLEGVFELARREGDGFRVATSARLRVNPDVWELAYGEAVGTPEPEPSADEERQRELRDAARPIVAQKVAELLRDADPRPRVRVVGEEARPLVACEALWATTPASSVRVTTLASFDIAGEPTAFGIVGDDFAGDSFDGHLHVAFSDRWGPFTGQTRLHVFDAADEAPVAATSIPGVPVDRFSIAAVADGVSLITVDGNEALLHTFGLADATLASAEAAALTDDEVIVANRITSRAAYVATAGDAQRVYAIPHGSSDVAGPFEVGGVPAMIHSVDDQILVVAQENDADGQQIGVRIDLFGSESQPVASTAISTGDYAAWSEAMWEPRSLTYAAAQGLVVFPVNAEQWAEGENFSGAVVYALDGVEPRAAIDHSDLHRLRWCRANDQADDCAIPSASWWTHVRRSVVVDDVLVTVSEAGVKTNAVADFADLGQIVF